MPLTQSSSVVGRCLLLFVAMALAMLAMPARAADDNVANADDSKPIRALLVTGGCCHDYARQKLILTKGISARANVVWTVAHQGGSATNSKIPLYEDADWAKGFDVIVHNECFADVKEVGWVDRVLKPHREGTPALVIHCAMHCYRTGTDKWFEFIGMTSHRHGAHYPFEVVNLDTASPIMTGFGDKWMTPQGELYIISKVWPTAHPLAHAMSRDTKNFEPCVWTNMYGDTRVFGTTIGHHNETMAEPKYLDMVTRGLLWAVKREGPTAFHKTDAETDAAIKALISVPLAESGGGALPTSVVCCKEGNLAFGKPTQASTEEKNKNNMAPHAVDGKLNTRWCANGARSGEWWQVDLGKAEHVKSLRIHWEGSNAAYRYKVDASANGSDWRTIVDESNNKKVAGITPHEVDAADTRYLRVTFLGSSTGAWGSLWEFEAYADKLPPLPAAAVAAQSAAGPAATVADVQAPTDFNVTLFGAPPTVNYPVCIAAAPTGELFVGVDEQGSLGKEKGKGKVLRCIDTDGDGVADKINVFATMDHPRGLVYDNGTLWVLHPPFMTVYHDDNHDGVADRSKVLITGISTDEVNKRGADHTTNGIRMGIDGWIYIAVGDFGFTRAEAADGTVLSRRGGGIVRIRPDGSDMEIFAWGTRNILDVCIDPYMNVFTRDNTNDGGGWNVRLSHILQSGEYGYPSLYMHFADELMPTLADYGGGSGTGGMFFHDLRWPAPFNNALYTTDWGRSEVYRHNLPAHGATFDAAQEVFFKLPRPTDIDVDGSGRMYVSSWKNGQFSYKGPDVGFVAQVTPRDFTPKPFPDLVHTAEHDLISYLSSPSAVYRLHSQREILRRGQHPLFTQALTALAADAKAPLYGRVAAIFTLAQLDGVAAHPAMLSLAHDPTVREFALRALTDRKSQLTGVPVEPFINGLSDANPRVRAAAIIGLGRLGQPDVAPAILPLTRRANDAPLPTKDPLHVQPDPARVVPHLAVRALVALNAVDTCLAALDGPYRDGALWALRNMHEDRAVAGLTEKLASTTDPALRRDLLTALIRLYYVEGEYKSGWWGTRPDNSGPYYDRQTWSQSARIAEVVRAVMRSADKTLAQHITEQLALHKVKIDGLPAASQASGSADPQTPLVIPQVAGTAKDLIANMEFDKVAAAALAAKGDVARGQSLFTKQGCIACHTYANGQTPKGPHLVDIGKRYKPAEIVESIVKPSAKIAQGFDTWRFEMKDGQQHVGFVSSESADTVSLRNSAGIATEIAAKEIDNREKIEGISIMPNGLVGNLKPEQLADLVAYLESLK